MPVFDRFPQEAALVGKILAGYGEIEFELCSCVAAAQDDLDMVFKAMFRPRGETQRIDIADALGRKRYRASGLEQIFSEAIGDTRYCLKIRNQYSHCTWHDDLTGHLAFVELEEIAAKHEVIDLRALTTKHLDIHTLTEQHNYFRRVINCLTYLNFEIRRQAGSVTSHPFRVPQKVRRPLLHIP